MARRPVRNPVVPFVSACLIALAGSGYDARAQTSPAPAPGPTTPATPVPAPAPVSPVAPSAGLPTLAPAPADPATPDEVTLSSRPALTLRGQSTWDDGYDVLTQAFGKLKSEAGKAGLQPGGLPLATFLETDDTGFKFEAQLPLAGAPAGRPAGLAPEVGVGKTPEGKAIRFVHRAPYDDIDSTYEAISAYLDSKGIEVKESFTEEYVNPGTNAGDTGMELYIYVQPK